jgi:transposase
MPQRRRRRAVTDSFKAEVVELCRKGDRSVPEVARELDLTETAVRRWVQQAEIDAGQRPGLTSSAHEELVGGATRCGCGARSATS